MQRDAEDELVAVVVVTFRSSNLLNDLLASFAAGFGEVAHHLVVVDNASTDGTVEAVRSLAPGATLVERATNDGYAAGINAGVAAAPPHTAVLVLNPDVRLGPGCVPALLRALRRPGTGIAVPRLVDGDGVPILSLRREPSVLRALADATIGAERVGRLPALGEVVSSSDAYRREHVADWAEGSTQLVSAECWAATGPWDERYFLFSEETDFDLRARDAGFALRFAPDAVATHLQGGSGTSPGLWRLLVLNRVRLYARRHGRAATAAFWAATLLREATRALLGWDTSRVAAVALLDRRRWRQRPGPDAVAR